MASTLLAQGRRRALVTARVGLRGQAAVRSLQWRACATFSTLTAASRAGSRERSTVGVHTPLTHRSAVGDCRVLGGIRTRGLGWQARSLCTEVGGAESDEFYADELSFAEFGLHEELVKRLANAGFTRPSRVQAQTLRKIMNGDDAVISAETGSGKTLAYLLPILHALLRQCPPVNGVIPAPESPVGLVIVPSVDLVRQVATVAGELVPELVPEGGVFMVHGRYGPTRHDKVAIVVATPKALLENMRAKALRALRVVVVDEADILISGSLQPALQDFLARLKMRIPAERPQHIFAAISFAPTPAAPATSR